MQLTYPPDRAAMPRWSPDGSEIAYMSARRGKPWKATLIPKDGGTPEHLIPGNSTESDPNWSPEGNRLVFARGENAVAGSAGPRTSDIRILDLKSRQVSKVPGSEGLFSPRWSADGRYLVGMDAIGGPSTKLFLYDFSTQEWTTWVSEKDPNAGPGYPAWTSDSRYVEYVAGDFCKRIRIGDDHPEILFSLKGFTGYFSEFASWSDNAPDGSRMFVRDASVQEIYSLDAEFP